ncbi:MAG: hypothetical protein ACOYXM_07315 [Actinomycetota bacterium]
MTSSCVVVVARRVVVVASVVVVSKELEVVVATVVAVVDTSGTVQFVVSGGTHSWEGAARVDGVADGSTVSVRAAMAVEAARARIRRARPAPLRTDHTPSPP